MRIIFLTRGSVSFLRIKAQLFLKNIFFNFYINILNDFYLYKGKYSIKIKIINFIQYRQILNWLFSLIYKLSVGYYFDLRIKGLGFRIRKFRRLKYLKYLKFLLGHSVYKYMLDQQFIFLRNIYKFQLILFSPFAFALNNIIAQLLLFRVIRPYKIKGILNKRIIYVLRPGKIR